MAREILTPNDDRVLLSSTPSQDNESSDFTSTISSFIFSNGQIFAAWPSICLFVCFGYWFVCCYCCCCCYRVYHFPRAVHISTKRAHSPPCDGYGNVASAQRAKKLHTNTRARKRQTTRSRFSFYYSFKLNRKIHCFVLCDTRFCLCLCFFFRAHMICVFSLPLFNDPALKTFANLYIFVSFTHYSGPMHNALFAIIVYTCDICVCQMSPHPDRNAIYFTSYLFFSSFACVVCVMDSIHKVQCMPIVVVVASSLWCSVCVLCLFNR